MEEWVLLGESGSDADSVQFVDGSASDKGSEMSFTTVQIGGNRPSADALDSSCGDGEELPGSPIGGAENEDDEEKINGDYGYGYFDLDLPALAGSKAVFGASDDCFDLNLAASILSMGSVGCDAGIHGGHTADTDSDADDDDEPPELRTGGRHLDDIDTESITGAADGDGIEHPERRVCAHCANIDTDTESSDPEESDYANDTQHSELGDACCDDIDDTESSGGAADKEQPESCSRGRRIDDIDMESSDASGTTGGGDDARYSDIPVAVQRLCRLIAKASTVASPPPTALHLFFSNAPIFIPNRAETSTAASSRPPCAPHLYFRNRAQLRA